MGVYDVDGNRILIPYDKDGNTINTAFDYEGAEVFKQVRVMEYNVGGWYIGSGTNIPAAADATWYAIQNGIIASQNADIMCICEYWNQFSQAGRTALSVLNPYYDYIHAENGNSQYYGRCICSKYEILSYTAHTYTGDGDGRYYDEAVISIEGESVHVFVTHLHPSDSTKRIAQATELFNYVHALTDKYIIAGDFNSNLLYPFSEVNAAIYNQFLNDGCEIANDGDFGILPTACNTANWDADKFAIDNIITSDGISINSVWTDLTKTTNVNVLSTGKIDHVPLIADINIRG